MTEDEATRALETFLAAHGVRGGLDFGRRKIGGVMLGAAELFFEYAAERGELWCGALVYRFRRDPRPGVLDAFAREEQRSDTGGGRLEYRAESRALFLSLAYVEAAADADFARDLRRLADASLVWAGEIAGRVADQTSRAAD